MSDVVDLVRSDVACALSRFQVTPTHFYLAFSGGVDSTALLDAVCSYLSVQNQHRLSLIHVNHALYHDADDWESHCIQVARDYNLSISTHHVQIHSEGAGVECASRKARWSVFTDVLSKKNSCLLLAHHANDQVETFFLRLMRGAGLSGLTSMQQDCTLSGIRVVRPLLSIDKKTISNYAQVLSLSYISDPSNFESTYDRNYIRNRVVPLLADRWQSAVNQVSRSISHLQSDWDYLLNIASSRLDELVTLRFGLHCIDQYRFNALSESERYLCLRAFVLKQGWYLPSSKQMTSILEQIYSSRKGSTCSFQTDQFRLVVYASYVYVIPRGFFISSPISVKAKLSPGLLLYFYCPNRCRVVADWSKLIDHAVSSECELVFGDSVVSLLGAKRCKKLLQSKGVPLILRPFYPFLKIDDQCLPVSFVADEREVPKV